MGGFMSESATLARPANTVPTTAAPWREGLESARALLGPGLVLQSAALALVLAYYFVPAAHAQFAWLAAWRTEGGYLFSATASALCGGLIPFLYLQGNKITRSPHPAAHLIFFCAFWAWKGAEVDLWYRVLGALLGNGTSVATVAGKMLLDQFGYNLFYAAPISSLCFAWKDARFRWAPVAADLRAGRWYARRALPVLIAVWCVWIPVVCCVYTLPAALQIPLFNVVLCFWSMLFAHVTIRQNRKKEHLT
jgi:hypothetical protein